NFFKSVYELDIVLFLCHLRLVATNVEIRSGCDGRNLADYVVNKLKRRFLLQRKRAESDFGTIMRQTCNRSLSFTWFDFNRWSRKQLVWIRHKCSVDVPRKIYFRYDCNEAALCIRNNFFVLFLRIKPAFASTNLALAANSGKVGP